MKRSRGIKISSITAILALMMVFQGCSILQKTEQPNLQQTAFSLSVMQTATAAKEESGKEDTLGTAQAEATTKAESILATQTAQSVGRSEEQLAQATVAAPILAELPEYGLSSAGGRVGWVQGPLVLDVTGYTQMTYGNDHMEVTAADFAMAADITWDTQYGSSGCGFFFRSDGDQQKPNQYMILATRFGNGHIIFMALAEGEPANLHDFYPASQDRSFQWQNKTTNRVAIVARGNLIEIYTNYIKIGEIDTTKPPERLPAPPKPQRPSSQEQAQIDAYNAQIAEYTDIMKKSEENYQISMTNFKNKPAVFTDGFLAMIAASESGHTNCTFDNAWLWLIEP